ncbi:hypothetical protein, partial [Bacillus sp. WP8]|uniref:hypothetical protein n=1 Tax=Bacillus sp. WP8 TaxID=756828 RepID=UPI001C93084D
SLSHQDPKIIFSLSSIPHHANLPSLNHTLTHHIDPSFPPIQNAHFFLSLYLTLQFFFLQISNPFLEKVEPSKSSILLKL